MLGSEVLASAIIAVAILFGGILGFIIPGITFKKSRVGKEYIKREALANAGLGVFCSVAATFVCGFVLMSGLVLAAGSVASVSMILASIITISSNNRDLGL